MNKAGAGCRFPVAGLVISLTDFIDHTEDKQYALSLIPAVNIIHYIGQ